MFSRNFFYFFRSMNSILKGRTDRERSWTSNSTSPSPAWVEVKAVGEEAEEAAAEVVGIGVAAIVGNEEATKAVEVSAERYVILRENVTFTEFRETWIWPFFVFTGTWSSRSQCQRRNVLPIFGLKKGLRSFKKETSGKWQINFDDEHTQTINLSYKKKRKRSKNYYDEPAKINTILFHTWKNKTPIVAFVKRK